MNISWLEFGKSILYTNTSTNYCKEFRVGDTITFQGRPKSSPLVIITDFTSLKFLASASLALLLVEASSYARVVVGRALKCQLNREN
jgi:hypothetical protein